MRMLSEVDDSELARLAELGREPAFRELLIRYERPIFSLIYRMVRDRELAEDLAQETFVRAFNAIASYNSSYKFNSWIFKIASNHTINYLRKGKLDTVSIFGTSDEGLGDRELQIKSITENPHEFTERRELGGRIEVAIGELREEYRMAILLYHVEGYSYKEIADIMDIPLGTAKTYLSRARKELKKHLEYLRAS
ncbi:MAG TPA: sigma-70 family RNA polymerase sigma factor [Gemmatimonadetes bacterium]|nr:sigma-70 family RNA polymerase sigma factor [Gemmatimonadota bacterium]